MTVISCTTVIHVVMIIGLVLSGGGVRGVAHIGVIKFWISTFKEITNNKIWSK